MRMVLATCGIGFGLLHWRPGPPGAEGREFRATAHAGQPGKRNMIDQMILHRLAYRIRKISSILLAIAAPLGGSAAPTIWSGPLLSFTKANGANGSLAANQDRMTSDIWLARGATQGLFNAETESAFTHFLSPSGTEWANGMLANYASLSYTDWNHWAKGVNPGPPSTVGVQAVLHLIPDDIYLSVQFTSWGGTPGGFSY